MWGGGGGLYRSGRVLVGPERSLRSMKVLAMFKTIVVLRRFATIFFFRTEDNPSAIITLSGICVSLSSIQSWRFVDRLEYLQRRLRSIVSGCSTIYRACDTNSYDNHRFPNGLSTILTD